VSHIISNDLVMFAAIKTHPNAERIELAQIAHELAGRPCGSFVYDKTMWLALLDRLLMLGYVQKVGVNFAPTKVGTDFLGRQALENQAQAVRIYQAIAFGIF
jgi:hypothetical protein